jgi:hypothetical protein
VEFLEAVDCRVLFQLDATTLHKDDRLRHEKFDRVNFLFTIFKRAEELKKYCRCKWSGSGSIKPVNLDPGFLINRDPDPGLGVWPVKTVFVIKAMDL